MIDRRLPPAIAAAAAALLLSGCPQDPLGPENRLAVLALSQCRHAEAMDLADRAARSGHKYNVQRALLLKAAILRDSGDAAAAEALYPDIEAAWRAAKQRDLDAERREREIGLFLEVARQERRAKGLPLTCSAADAGVDAGTDAGAASR
jgi:hypothetical protein